jgi:hypothetical protein
MDMEKIKDGRQSARPIQSVNIHTFRYARYKIWVYYIIITGTNIQIITTEKKALFSLSKHFNIYEGTSVRDLLHLFDTVVKPQLLYAPEVWGAYLFRKLSAMAIL